MYYIHNAYIDLAYANFCVFISIVQYERLTGSQVGDRRGIGNGPRVGIRTRAAQSATTSHVLTLAHASI